MEISRLCKIQLDLFFHDKNVDDLCYVNVHICFFFVLVEPVYLNHLSIEDPED